MKRLWIIAETAALAVTDQVFKSYVEQKLEQGEEKLLKGRLVLRRVKNKGMCLNFLQEKPKVVRVLSTAAASAVTAVLAAVLFRKGHVLQKQGLVFVSAGAWSNTFDRWFRDGVVDYIGIKRGRKELSGITYNLADFFIFAGSGAAAVSALLSGKRKRVKKRKNMV